tara:strand:+ start:2234 stop:3355 length:1122 start_codon:yes stop_codon:yes gene_type:complete
MTLHAKLSASGAHRWMACPGSVAAEDGIPDRTSSFAEEGTRAHDVMEQALMNQRPCSDFTTDNGIAEGVQVYVDYIEATRAKTAKETWMFIERRVDFSEWVPDGFGTADTIIVSDEVIHVVDLKFGKGVQVYAENNPQAQLYALGAYAELGFISNPKTVRISIVQPRLDHISEWEISITDLLKFGETARQAALDTQNPNAKRVPGEKQCRFCKAKATCPALFKLTEQTLMADFEQLDEAPPANKLTDEQMRVVLENKTLVEAWLISVENFAKEKIISGADFQGFKLVEGRSLRRWSDEKLAAHRLLELARAEDIYTRKLISPAQAEKLLGKKDKAAIEDFIEKPRGSPTLAREDDPRPSITATINDFEQLDDE